MSLNAAWHEFWLRFHPHYRTKQRDIYKYTTHNLYNTREVNNTYLRASRELCDNNALAVATVIVGHWPQVAKFDQLLGYSGSSGSP